MHPRVSSLHMSSAFCLCLNFYVLVPRVKAKGNSGSGSRCQLNSYDDPAIYTCCLVKAFLLELWFALWGLWDRCWLHGSISILPLHDIVFPVILIFLGCNHSNSSGWTQARNAHPELVETENEWIKSFPQEIVFFSTFHLMDACISCITYQCLYWLLFCFCFLINKALLFSIWNNSDLTDFIVTKYGFLLIQYSILLENIIVTWLVLVRLHNQCCNILL